MTPPSRPCAELGDDALDLGRIVYSSRYRFNVERPTQLLDGSPEPFAVISGCIRTGTRVIAGAASFRTSSHLPPMAGSKLVKPVMLSPGRAKLSTKPLPAGSATKTNSRPA